MTAELLLGDLQAVIRDEARRNPRSLQVSVGPSEIGQKCERRLALGLLGAEAINDDRDEWTSTVGTALHTWMEKAFRGANERLQAQGKPPRWLVETAVDVRTGLVGHVDVYDIWTGTVLDHKFPGVTAIRGYKKAKDPHTGLAGYPGQQYEWQGHLYGLGWKNLGLPVTDVAICMYPRSGLIRDSWLWKTPFNESIAQTALARVDELITGMDIAEGLAELPTFMEGLKLDTKNCTWCQFYKRGHTDPTTGCQGPFEDPTYAANNATVVDGIL